MQQALITRNRMRVDLLAEFFVRVGGTRALVAAAAQTLGRRTLQPDGLRELLEGKFAGCAAHRRRTDDAGGHARTARRLCRAGAANGDRNRSRRTGWNWNRWPSSIWTRRALNSSIPSNAFDAEGLTALTQSIETRRKMRNEIEQQTLVDIRNQNLETQRQRAGDRP